MMRGSEGMKSGGEGGGSKRVRGGREGGRGGCNVD